MRDADPSSYADTNRNGYRDSYSHGYTNGDGHSQRFRQSDTDTQTDPHSEIPCDTEAATHTAAAAMR
jgi:hypothetical protein